MTASETQLLTMMANHGNMSLIVVDRNARITQIVGEIKHHGSKIDKKTVLGQSIDSFFKDIPQHANRYHDALKNLSSKVVIPNGFGGFSEIQIAPLCDQKNKIIGAFSIERDVTDWVKLEQTAEAHESFVANIFASIQEGIFVIDREYTILKTNPAFEAMYPECMPLVGKKCYETSCLDHVCEACPATEMFATGKTSMSIHYELPTDTKPGMWLEHHAHPIVNSSGETVASICMIRDITQRKENEDALEQYRSRLESKVEERTYDWEQSESKMQTIISKGNIPVAFADPSGILVFVNAAFQALTGYPEHELLGKTLIEVMLYDERTLANKSFLLERIAFYERKRDQHHQDIAIRRKNGEQRWVDFTASVVKNSEGNRTQVIFTLLDITERYQMVQAIVEANEQTQIMLDSTPMGCTLFDDDGTVIDCNREALSLLGTPTKKEYCEQFYKLSPDYQPDGMSSIEKSKMFIDAARRNGSHRMEWMHRNVDGMLIPCDVTMVRVKRGDSCIFTGYAQDIREHKKMLAKMREADERMQIMLDATPLCCNLWDEHFNHIDCNLEAVKLFGLTDKKEYLERFYELSPTHQLNGSLSRTKIMEHIVSAFRDGYCQFEWRHQLLDGTPIPTEMTLVCVKRGEGYIVAGYTRDLREYKKMLAQMREADERAQTMLDATPLCCILWDEHLNTIDCNAEAVHLFGLKDKRDFCNRFFELSPPCQPDGRPSWDLAVEYVMKTLNEKVCRFEWMHQKLDGSPIPAEVTLVHVQQGEGPVVAGYVRDLRDEKRMLTEKREAEERTHIMLDATPLGCSLVDRDARVIDCNRAALHLFGMPSKQEYRNQFANLMPEFQPDGRASVEGAIAIVRRAYETGYECTEWMHQTLDGLPIPTEVTLVRVKREEGDIVAGYTRDLREIKKHEAIQERNRQRTNALLELAQMTQQQELEIIDYAIKSVIALTDSTMGYVVLLEHAKDVLPFRSLILDQSFHCSLPTTTVTGTPHVLSAALTTCLETKQAVIHDDFASLPGLRTFPEGHCSVHSHMNCPIMDGEKPVGILGVGNKTTPYIEADAKQLTLLAQGLGNLLNRKKHAESLEKAKNEAEEANKAKSEFLAHMSHEIRTPLNGVIGLSDLLTGTALNEKQREYVQLINDSGKSLLFLINDILDFSKIEAGKLEIYPEPFDLSATIGAVLAALVSRVSGKNLELAVSLCQNLPRIMRGDSGRVRQILINLAANAVKFTQEGGVRIDVTIESISGTTLTVKFAVIDTGIGIPQSGIERLFKAFSQVDASSARTYGGTGLGLAISMRLVRLMGGEIGVTSTEGKGSTFWFTVPFECEDIVIRCLQTNECQDKHCLNVDGHTCMAFVNREIDAEYGTEGRAALIVDDNDVQREALRIQLKNWGMRCVTCSSEKEALQLSAKHWELEDPFDLYVIDSTIIGGIGTDLVHKLFKQEYEQNHSKISQAVLLRSLADNININALDETRAEPIGKPVFPSALFNAVMNRIFALERLRDIDSGVFPSREPGSERVVKSKIFRYSKPDEFTSSAKRLKSSLAGKVHVLVVEDNRVNQIVATNILAEAGFTCDIANDGNEACSAVRNKEYDVVLMDCQMPEMDGYDATNLIRHWELDQGRKRLPIIALTANAVKEDVQKCFDAGMDAYCSKPINSLVLVRLIEEWYEKRR